jgi:hypothetical protein
MNSLRKTSSILAGMTIPFVGTANLGRAATGQDSASSDDQTLSPYAYNVRINKTSGTVTLNDVRNELTVMPQKG